MLNVINFFKMAECNSGNITRGNSKKLYKPRLNKGMLQRSNFFSIRKEVISAKTVNSFKNRLDKYISNRHGAQEAMPNILPPLA